MADATFRRALRSSDLPQPRSLSRVETPTRRQALSQTVSDPEFREVEVAGRPVLLTRLPSGTAVAFAAECPHQGTSLRHASLYEGNLRCPQHNYVYDLHTGRNILPTRDARPGALARLKPGYLATYPVRERHGWILVGEEPNPRPPTSGAPTSAEPAPAAAPEHPGGAVEHREETLSVVVGQEFELVLPTRPRPSHLWTVESDGAAVEILGQRYREEGDGLCYRIRLGARREGVARLRCAYGRPWEREASIVRPFVVRVTRS